MSRNDKHNYYLNIAQVVLERGTCLRRNYGSIIVKNDEIIATGYTGSARGRENCVDNKFCLREKMKIEHGKQYELCKSVHSEANAIISASRRDMIGSTLYLVGVDKKTGEIIENACSCFMCKRLIINAGISVSIVRNTKIFYKTIEVKDWIENEDF
ncbi:MAG: cytidine deaminase [Clostridiales bacterium]|jgi:dCMP deaminase|nr:cytidine deaminase [Clostridiales bacterium]